MRLVKIAALVTILGVCASAGISLADQETPLNAEAWPGWHGWHGHGFGFWWMFPLMMLFMFLFLLFVVGSRDRSHRWWWMRGYHSQRRDHGATPNSALDILDKRYARGEIDKEEYQEKKAAISSSNP